MKEHKLSRVLTTAAAIAFGATTFVGFTSVAQAAANSLQTVQNKPTWTSTQINASTSAVGVALTGINAAGGPGGVSGQTAMTETSTSAAAPGAGLFGTSHDFINGDVTTTGTQIGLCTFCHTPHQASTTLLLWNHTMSANSFDWNVAATTSGTALPGFVGNAYNGPSAKCLSCHDGSVAIGDVGWFEGAAHHGANSLNTFHMTSDTSRMVGQNGDLSGNHPVAIPYPYLGAPNVYNGSTDGAQLATNDFVSDPTQNNIRLYSDLGGGLIVGRPEAGKTGIECSSCHDPHNRASVDDLFLRGKLAGETKGSGYICLQCHVK